ncbi:hypothetical protein [Cerasicoccus arenae]|uniref:Uncharacterized protein n=1 Tax=Cerasicoccus arenae TaxID=424488 RepID=A0A8J3DFD0_9BACT|nr:hypothetical protein [Cerasicoccus arenae]MBK1857106.1 hypothetical protein [Cerasicoccus arenae]GHB92399.1 hypothetical protein GCM10007047_04380 [Cerasicoccus arenae]
MAKLLETESFVAIDAAWHQSLTVDQALTLQVVVQTRGSDPIFGFYLKEADFRRLMKTGEVDDHLASKIHGQTLFANANGRIKTSLTLPVGKWFVCIELDCEAAPNAKKVPFTFTLLEN